MDDSNSARPDDIRLISSPKARVLLDICEPVLNGLGFDCVHLEYQTGKPGILRLYIDGPQGVVVQDCARVSRQLSALLEVEDPISGGYTLEVSSPGLNRPLGRTSDFEKNLGSDARITTEAPVAGRRKWKGKLVGVVKEQVTLHVDGEDIVIPFNAIKKANIEFNFEAVQP